MEPGEVEPGVGEVPGGIEPGVGVEPITLVPLHPLQKTYEVLDREEGQHDGDAGEIHAGPIFLCCALLCACRAAILSQPEFCLLRVTRRLQ